MNPPADDCTLWRATPEHLRYVYETERLPGYESLTARWSLEAHLLASARPDTRYLIGGTQSGHPMGFVILQPLADAHEGTKIKRIVVSQPGQGFGQRLLAATYRWVFGNTTSHRIWLDVFAHNARAIAAYRASGMTVDGVLRASYEMEEGRYVDRWVMALLRDEWVGRTSE